MNCTPWGCASATFIIVYAHPKTSRHHQNLLAPTLIKCTLNLSSIPSQDIPAEDDAVKAGSRRRLEWRIAKVRRQHARSRNRDGGEHVASNPLDILAGNVHAVLVELQQWNHLAEIKRDANHVIGLEIPAVGAR